MDIKNSAGHFFLKHTKALKGHRGHAEGEDVS